MTDFLARVLIGVVVSAVVSAGIMYFAFDQSLRGIESALTAQTAAIAESNQWTRSVDGKVTTAQDAVVTKLEKMDAKIDKILALQESNAAEFNKTVSYVWTDIAELQGHVLTSLEASRSVAISLKASLATTDPNYAIVSEFVNQLETANANLRALKLPSSERAVVNDLLPTVTNE